MLVNLAGSVYNQMGKVLEDNMYYDAEHCSEILRLLIEAHPDAAPELRFKNPLE